MLIFTLVRHGFARAARHPGAVLLLFLAGLVPALLVTSLISADLAPALDSSLFAAELLEGNSLGVWIDYQRSEGADLQPLGAVLPWRFLLVVLLQILVAAGLVEVLLERSAGRERPFLAGVGRHGWRFLRSGLVFGVFLLLAVLATSPVSLLFREGDDTRALVGTLTELIALYLLYLVLHAAYDLSRIAAAAHGDGRMLVGFFKALGFTFRKLHVLLPLGIFFTLLPAILRGAGFYLRSRLELTTGGEVLGWLVGQQVLFFALAFLRTSLWGAEVAYFQGLGEPRWCGRKGKPPTPPPSLGDSPPPRKEEPAAAVAGTATVEPLPELGAEGDEPAGPGTPGGAGEPPLSDTVDLGPEPAPPGEEDAWTQTEPEEEAPAGNDSVASAMATLGLRPGEGAEEGEEQQQTGETPHEEPGEEPGEDSERP